MVKRGKGILFLILLSFISIIFLSGFASAVCQAMTPSIDIIPASIASGRFDLNVGGTFSIDVTNNDIGIGCPEQITLQIESCINTGNPLAICRFSTNQQTYTINLNEGQTQTLSNVLTMGADDWWSYARVFSVIKAYPISDSTKIVRETAVAYRNTLILGSGLKPPTISSLTPVKTGTGTQTFKFSITQNSPGDNDIKYFLTPICPSGWICIIKNNNGGTINYVWLDVGVTRSFIIYATPPAGTSLDSYPIFAQVHGDTGDYVNVWQLSPKATYNYTGGTPPSEVGNCNDGIDNDADGYIDYADSDCIPTCSGVVTGRISGYGDGTAWSPDDLTPNIAKCCAVGQCLDINTNNCVNSGTTRTIDGYRFICSTSVWCKNGDEGNGGAGYSNDGDGNCVGGDIAQSTFTGIDACLAPSAAYYHGFSGGRIVLWNSTNFVYNSSNGVDFKNNSRANLVSKGISLTYQPTLGIYSNISGSGGRILLFDASGNAYITAYENPDSWSVYDKVSRGLPLNFNPISARYTMQPPGIDNKGIVELDNIINEEYRIGGLSATTWSDSTSLYNAYSNYPMGNPLLVTYYYNISGNEHMAYWLNRAGTLEVYQYNGMGYDSFQEITPMLAGLPPLDQMPTEGYFDPIRKKIVIWYGNDAYESENNIYFKKINGFECNLCGNGVLDSSAGEECDDGNIINEDECTNLCLNAVCGDGYLNSANEQCDDGNLVNGDWCSSVCKIEQEELCSIFMNIDDCNNELKWSDQILRKIEEHNKILAETNEWPYDFCTTGKVSGVSCGCSWNSISNECIESVSFDSGQCFITNVEAGTCSAGNTATESWTASWNGGGENSDKGCVSGSKLYNCQLIAKVPFFSLTNLLISIFLIGILYLIINIKRIK